MDESLEEMLLNEDDEILRAIGKALDKAKKELEKIDKEETINGRK